MTPKITPDIIIMLIAVFGAAILSGVIENITKKKRTKEDDIKLISGLILGTIFFIAAFPKVTIFIIFIIIVIFLIRKIMGK